MDPLRMIVELGSGNGEKLRTLIEVGRASSAPIDVHLIDISTEALHASARALQRAQDASVAIYDATYEDGLGDVADIDRASGRALVVFLGSNIGNFDPPGAEAFVRNVRATLRAGDGFLLGADLVKPEAQLRVAYDDPLGVTAAMASVSW